MVRFPTRAGIVVASALAAACASSGGPQGYPESYTRQQAETQELVASRYDAQTIMQAQRALAERRFYAGPIDGIWGPSSQSALASFQRANGLAVDGHLGPQALAALDVGDAGARVARDGSMQQREAPASRDPQALADSRTILEVQRALAARGFDVGRVDGVWGPESQGALREFQRNEGLQASGRIDAPTLAALDIPR